MNHNYLYGVIGHVSDILTPDKAVIQFALHGKNESAFLKGNRFFHNGKPIPDGQNLNKYIRCGSQVKFSCHVFDKSDFHEYGWFVGMCWLHDDSERNVVKMSTGMENISGQVNDLKQRQGLLLMIDSFGREHKVHFLASKFYLYGKRLPASKSLSSGLTLEDRVYFDATPCFPEENHYSCRWFATCVYKGKKPELAQYKDPSLNRDFEPAEEDAKKLEKKEDKLLKAKDKVGQLIDLEKETRKGKTQVKGEELLDKTHQSGSIVDELGEKKLESGSRDREEVGHQKKELARKSKHGKTVTNRMLHDIKLLSNNPRSVFATGRGIIMSVVNDEYAVILGEFKRNVLQTILFHRTNASLFKMSLAHSKLSEIFIEGDRVRFIAVAAPVRFQTDWIATQVSVVCPGQLEDPNDDPQ